MRRGEVHPHLLRRGIAHRPDLAEQGGEGGLGAGPVAPVGVHVLAEQRDAAAAARHQRLHLAQHVAGRARHLAPAGVGHGAEGTELVAAVLDRHVGGVGRAVARGDAPELIGMVERHRAARLQRGVDRRGRDHTGSADQLRELWQVVDAEHQVEQAQELGLVLRQDAAGHESEQRPLPLPPVPLVDAAVDAVDRLLAHRAGHHAEQVGLPLLLRLGEAGSLQHRRDPLRVRGIHLAAQRQQPIGHRDR